MSNTPVGSTNESRLYAKIGSEGISEILGKILTFADMSFQDPEQRKAFKDSAKSAIWNWWHNYELFNDETITNIPNMSDGTITFKGHSKTIVK
jgi:hypothetical protein